MSTYSPDAFLVVFAVDDEASLDQADRYQHFFFSRLSGFLILTFAHRILRYIRPELGGRPCILVANKTDLVRNRVVRTGGEQINLILP